MHCLKLDRKTQFFECANQQIHVYVVLQFWIFLLTLFSQQKTFSLVQFQGYFFHFPVHCLFFYLHCEV